MQKINSLTSPEPSPDADLPLADASYDPTTSPVVASVLSAEVPGVLFTLEDLKSPDVAPVVANARALPGKGLGVYTNPEKKLAALFNPEVITMEELKAVDKAGKLDKILVPYSQLGKKSTALASGAPPTEPAPAPILATPVPPPSRGAQTAAARKANSPQKQKTPGAGSFINSLV